MIREKTIGIITFKKKGRSIHYLLLHYGGEYWNFPKGHQEKEESELDTALREVREETGIGKVKIIEGFKYEYDYDFNTKVKDGIKQQVYRHAIFFLGEIKAEKIKISNEHLDYGWFDFETALERLFYQESQNSLRRAHQLLL